MQTTFTRLAVGATVLGLAACSGGGSSSQPLTVANVSTNILQMAVGTVNFYGTSTGLNVFTTYRQPNGNSGTLVNSPTLTVPFTLPAATGSPDAFHSTIETGPGPTEVLGRVMTSTTQTGTNATTFGASGGVFGLGIEPFNYSEFGTPDNVPPYTVPLYDTVATDPNAFIPWGGPPAFDPNHDGEGVRDGAGYPDGTLGISEGLDPFFGLAPATGTYTLQVSIPGNDGTVTQSVNATLTSAAILGTVTAPTPVVDGTGGATFPVVLPAGVTEAYLQIQDIGPDPGATTQPTGCNTASAATPVYYTIEVTASGTATLPDTDGPGKTPSLCTSAQNSTAAGATTDGDEFTVQIIGFDYPAFEASYPNSLGVPSPKIAGAGGQADMTISAQTGFTQLAGAVLAPANVRTLHAAMLEKAKAAALKHR